MPINRRDMQVILVMLLFITILILHEIEMCVVSHTSVIYNIDKTNLSSIITKKQSTLNQTIKRRCLTNKCLTNHTAVL